MCDIKDKLIKNWEEIKDGNILLLKVNNFSSFSKRVSFDRYKDLIEDLYGKIINCIEYRLILMSYDEFWIISEDNVKIAIDSLVKDYILSKQTYLSVSMSLAQLKQNDSIEKIKYQMRASLAINPDLREPKKTYILYEAIYNKRLAIALQPIITKEGETYCHECLLRTYDNSFFSTSEIIDIAEKTGLINTLDEYVLELVIEEIRKNKNTILSINVSCDSINNAMWSKNFIRNIEKHDIAKNLIVEITETAIKDNYTRIAKFIDDIHIVGGKVSLDDFGTGYTSFLQLKSFNVDFVKIDGLFIKNIIYDKASALFVKSVIDISHSLGIKVIAECVEDKETANVLISLKIDFVQGFYFGKPVKV